MNFTSFKGRKLNAGKMVKVYRNLHNGKMSIQQGGLVVGHCDEIMINRAEFIVSEAGRQRVIKEKRKNVHAFVRGYLYGSCWESRKASGGVSVSYNPYKAGSFYVRETMEPVEKSAAACVSVKDGIKIFSKIR